MAGPKKIMNSGPKGNVKEETDRKGLNTQHYGTVRPGSELKVPHFKERGPEGDQTAGSKRMGGPGR